VFVLPGSCFTMDSFFRVVLCAPADTMTDAANRIKKFCADHRKK
jgi:aspartate/methionine/tyrosine aminotransferase